MHSKLYYRRGGVEVELSPRVPEIGVRSPFVTVVKTGNDSSNAKRSAIGESVTGPRDDHNKWMPCHSKCCTLKNPHCSMAMSAEHRSKFAALHQQW